MYVVSYRQHFRAIVPDVGSELTDDGSAVIPTANFINSATERAQVVLVFFTPRSGMVTGEEVQETFMEMCDILALSS